MYLNSLRGNFGIGIVKHIKSIIFFSSSQSASKPAFGVTEKMPRKCKRVKDVVLDAER